MKWNPGTILGKSLGTLHEDKPLDARSIVAKTDVISAMEAIEGKQWRTSFNITRF